MLKHILKLFSLILLIHPVFADNDLPFSRQAVLVESTSPTVVMIRATGIGTDPKHKRRPKSDILDKNANTDAKRTAVWFVLSGGTDPMLQTDEEKASFEKIKTEFYKLDNIKKFITWEAQYYDKRIKTDQGKKLKIEKTYKINKEILREYLVDKKILQKGSVVALSVGMPSVMVIPEKINGMAPIEILKTNVNYKKGAEVIESYLTARKFEVIVPEQQQILQELSSTQFALQGSEDDYSYLLALSIGSDVYITYNVNITTRKIGSSTVKKAVVGCRAFETTTSRLLGTETGYSEERTSADGVLIEEAMNDGIDKVLSRILAYWKKDLEQGIQYKLLLTVSDFFDIDEAEENIFSFGDLVKEFTINYKENVVSDYTYDLQIWVDSEKYRSSTDIYRFCKKNYKGYGKIKRVSISRKLILLDIVEE